MTVRRSFLLRIDSEVLDAVQRWANDDLRSLNGHIEFLLRAALKDAGRVPRAASAGMRATDLSDPAEASRSPGADAGLPASETVADDQEHGS
ncbi:MAG: hypothetical protein U0164_02875 [Gemmatimonadaceae bacterium]